MEAFLYLYLYPYICICICIIYLHVYMSKWKRKSWFNKKISVYGVYVDTEDIMYVCDI